MLRTVERALPCFIGNFLLHSIAQSQQLTMVMLSLVGIQYKLLLCKFSNDLTQIKLLFTKFTVVELDNYGNQKTIKLKF